MTPRTPFDVIDISRCRHQIEQINDIQRCRNPERNVVHAWTSAVGERHIVHAAFAVHPCRPKFLALIIFGVFRYAKAEIAIKFDRCIHIMTEAVKVVDPKRFNSAIQRVFLMDGV